MDESTKIDYQINAEDKQRIKRLTSFFYPEIGRLLGMIMTNVLGHEPSPDEGHLVYVHEGENFYIILFKGVTIGSCDQIETAPGVIQWKFTPILKEQTARD